jgi:hypothetical protein
LEEKSRILITYSNRVQTNPDGITPLEISLFKPVRPPVRLTQLSETTGSERHVPWKPPAVQRVIVGEAA